MKWTVEAAVAIGLTVAVLPPSVVAQTGRAGSADGELGVSGELGEADLGGDRGTLRDGTPESAPCRSFQLLDLPGQSQRPDAILDYFTELGYIDANDEETHIYNYMDIVAPAFWENDQVVIAEWRTGPEYGPFAGHQFHISDIVHKINTSVPLPPPLDTIIGPTMEWNAIIYRPVIATDPEPPGPYVHNRPYPDGRFYAVYTKEQWRERNGDLPPAAPVGFCAHEAMHIQQLAAAAHIELETNGEDEGWLGTKFYELQSIIFDLAYSAYTDTLESTRALEIAVRATTIESRNHTHKRAGSLIRRYLAVNRLPDLPDLTRDEIAYHATIILRAIDHYGPELTDRAPEIHEWDKMFGNGVATMSH